MYWCSDVCSSDLLSHDNINIHTGGQAYSTGNMFSPQNKYRCCLCSSSFRVVHEQNRHWGKPCMRKHVSKHAYSRISIRVWSPDTLCITWIGGWTSLHHLAQLSCIPSSDWLWVAERHGKPKGDADFVGSNTGIW